MAHHHLAAAGSTHGCRSRLELHHAQVTGRRLTHRLNLQDTAPHSACHFCRLLLLCWSGTVLQHGVRDKQFMSTAVKE